VEAYRVYRDELLSNESTVRIKGSVQGTTEKSSELALEPLAGKPLSPLSLALSLSLFSHLSPSLSPPPTLKSAV
jgi:hypothetical protein